jgi:hypothetical protein
MLPHGFTGSLSDDMATMAVPKTGGKDQNRAWLFPMLLTKAPSTIPSGRV